MQKRRIFFIMVFMLLLLLAACGNGESEETANESEASESGENEDTDELTEITYVQLSPSLRDLHLQFAAENGVYEENGIDLEITNFDGGGPEALAAVQGGDIDMGNFGTPILVGIAQGIPIQVVASPPLNDSPFLLSVSNDIESVEDLRGKILSTGVVGSGPHAAAVNILREFGIDEDEVDTRPAGGVDEHLLLREGTVDAAITTETVALQIEADGDGYTLLETANDTETYENYQHHFVFASKNIIENDPEAVRAVIKSQDDANEFARENLEELIDYAHDIIDLDKELIREYYEEESQNWIEHGEVNVEGTQNAYEILQSIGDIDQDFDSSEENWLNADFLPGNE